jgi:plastocyanin
MSERSDRHDIRGTAARSIAAAAVLVGGLVHLQLYFDGYRSLPDANLGRSFVLNGIASIAIAAALFVRRDALVRLAGLALTVGTLGAFAMSRRGDGVFGLRENGLQPSPQALVALVAELIALALLAVTFLPAVGGGTVFPRRVATAVAGGFVAAGVAGAVIFSTTADAPTVVAAAPGTVAIAGFAFDAPTITVATGATVTWTNADGFAHSVVARDDAFESTNIATGESYTHTFDTAGTYPYICGIHPSMAGTVVVTG